MKSIGYEYFWTKRPYTASQARSRLSNVNFDIVMRIPLISPLNIPTVKLLPTWGLMQRNCSGLLLIQVPGCDSAPQAHNRVSNVNFDIVGWVKAPGNKFHLNPKWARNLTGDSNWGHPQYRSWHLTPCLRCRIPLRHLSYLKTRAIPLTKAPSGKELCRWEERKKKKKKWKCLVGFCNISCKILNGKVYKHKSNQLIKHRCILKDRIQI